MRGETDMATNGIYGIEERKKQWDYLFSKGKPQCINYTIQAYWDVPVRPDLWPELKKERIEWQWVKYNRMMEKLDWLECDTIPHFDSLTGTEIFAEAFGCKVYRKDGHMPFALPLLKNASEVSRLKVPELSSSSLALLFEIADELKKRAGPDALFRLPDIQSPMDIAALIWDKSDFYIAMIDEPEAVKELAQKVYSLLSAFADEWFNRYGTAFIAHHPEYYMPEGITLSEDEIGIINPEMFNEFYLPELTKLSQRYNGIGIHCCANAKHQWNNLLKIPGLRVLNLCQTEEILLQSFDVFKDAVVQMPGWIYDKSWAEDVYKFPKGMRAIVNVAVQSKEEALKFSEILRRNCGRE